MLTRMPMFNLPLQREAAALAKTMRIADFYNDIALALHWIHARTVVSHHSSMFLTCHPSNHSQYDSTKKKGQYDIWVSL